MATHIELTATVIIDLDAVTDKFNKAAIIRLTEGKGNGVDGAWAWNEAQYRDKIVRAKRI